ncbi:MAG: hypothetical protein WDM76_11500 [Limisphaerales bacterium]
MRRRATKFKPAPAVASPIVSGWSRFPVWLIVIVLALVTIALYWPATQCDFINLDDPEYVTANVHVQNGLSVENIKWAFSNPVLFNWHPLTMLSYMMDCQFFGLNPWRHHLTSVLLHSLNTVLVFLFLRSLTGALWRSVLVAALFGWHPLHVESVAWVAERKDVLSTCFGLLSLIFYGRYAQKQSQAASSKLKTQKGSTLNSQPATIDYVLALLFLALGLMSKAMLVTWPFVMLLLDYWPLERFNRLHIWRLVVEKIPFFVLTVLVGIVTFVVQKQGGALDTGEALPLGARGGNALISYCRYLGKLIWPTDLAVFYPHPGHWPVGLVIMAGMLLLGISIVLIAKRAHYPYLLMGWLWFVGTLVPVIQLLQTGAHAMADRYTYIPSIGALILIVWGIYELTRSWRHQLFIFVGGGSNSNRFVHGGNASTTGILEGQRVPFPTCTQSHKKQ